MSVPTERTWKLHTDPTLDKRLRTEIAAREQCGEKISRSMLLSEIVRKHFNLPPRKSKNQI